MKLTIICGNVRGMNDKKKRNLVDLLFRNWNADIVCLFETKISGLIQEGIKQVGVELEAQGNSGRIVVYWDKRRWKCKEKLSYNILLLLLWRRKILALTAHSQGYMHLVIGR